MNSKNILFEPSPLKRKIFFILGDLFISIFTLSFAYLLRFNFEIEYIYIQSFWKIFSIIFILKFIFLYINNMYDRAWRFFSVFEVKNILYSHILGYFCAFILLFFLADFVSPYPRSVVIIDLFLSFVFIGFFRSSKRFFSIFKQNGTKISIILGANEEAKNIFYEFQDRKIVAVFDDSQMLIGTFFENIKIINQEKLEDYLQSNKIEEAIICKEYDRDKLNKIYDTLNRYKINDIKVAFANDEYKNNFNNLKNITIEDLLARKPKDLDKNTIQTFIKGKKILITGAGGSIGSELSKKCLKYGASQLILIDNSELNLYNIAEEIKQYNYNFKDDKNHNIIKLYLLNILDLKYLDQIFELHKPDVVIHAAAYKHVPLCEINPHSAIENNILGTKNITDIAIRHNCPYFMLISSDKAVRPANIMGATKRVCELYVQNINPKNTIISCVRFGNVLGSSGSVVPKFKEQIEQGGPLSVTHPQMTRYFMLIPEACDLVLQALAISEGGELFILDMGEPVKILDLAKKMVELSRKSNIKIEFSGIREGEKLYEELLISPEDEKSKYDCILVAKKTPYDFDKLSKEILELLEAKNKKEILKKIVKEYNAS